MLFLEIRIPTIQQQKQAIINQYRKMTAIAPVENKRAIQGIKNAIEATKFSLKYWEKQMEIIKEACCLGKQAVIEMEAKGGSIVCPAIRYKADCDSRRRAACFIRLEKEKLIRSESSLKNRQQKEVAELESEAIILPRINRLPEHIVAIIGEYSPAVANVRLQGKISRLYLLIAADSWLANKSDLQNYTGKQLWKIFQNTHQYTRGSSQRSQAKGQAIIAIRRFYCYEVKDLTKSLERKWAFLQNIKEYRTMFVAGLPKGQRAKFAKSQAELTNV